MQDTTIELKDSTIKSLYERLGGQVAIEAAVHLFYEKVLNDGELRVFFQTADLDDLRQKQIDFMTQAFGGPAVYKGLDMASAHKNMGITEEDFSRVVVHLKDTLLELGVADELITEVLSLLGPLAGDIISSTGNDTTKSKGDNEMIGTGQTNGVENGVLATNGTSERSPNVLNDLSTLYGTLEALQTNVFVADSELNLVFANKCALDTLEQIKDEIYKVFKVRIEDILGGSIHRFHKDPKRVENILRDPRALPHEAAFSFGKVVLRTSINGVFDARGNSLAYVVNWEEVSEQVRKEEEVTRMTSIVEQAPANIMFADRDYNITYVNPKSLETLREIEQHLPCRADEVVGKSIDFFHKNPDHQRKMLSNPNNLPHQATIEVGPETLTLLVSAVNDAAGNYAGAMVTWEVITEKLKQDQKLKDAQERERQAAEELKEKVDQILECVQAAAQGDLTQEIGIDGEDAIGQLGGGLSAFLKDLAQSISKIADNAKSLDNASESLKGTSQSLGTCAEETDAQANTVAAAAEEVSANINSVAAGIEEMNSSITDIASSANSAARIATDAVDKASKTNLIIRELGERSAEIGQVVKVITSIAEQTNLLALNATIEAARAGDAGKGFAVVANEVKELAKETAKSTEDISAKVQAIQSATNGAVSAIEEIGEVISSINEASTQIAGAVEEQTATTSEIGRSVSEAAKGSSEIAENIAGVATAARNTTEGANEALGASENLSQMSADLLELVGQFKY